MWKLTVRGYEKGKKYNSRKGRFSYFGSGLVTEGEKKKIYGNLTLEIKVVKVVSFFSLFPGEWTHDFFFLN